MTRQIYVCADHRNETFTKSEHYEAFHQISAVLNTIIQTGQDLLGKEDLTIAGDMITQLKAQLLAVLEEKVNALEPDSDADVRIQWGINNIKLNRRNKKHDIIFIMLNLLEMANIENEERGAIHFYSLAALDPANTYIAKTFKAEKNGIGMAAAFAKFTTGYEQYNTMQQVEFEERVQQLITSNFLCTEESEGNTLLYPTVKTNTIKII